MIGLVGAVALIVAVAMLIPEGEVVTLVTTDDQGSEHATQLWVVELDGRLYLRSAEPDTYWLARLKSRAKVGLVNAPHITHDTPALPYRAVIVEDPATAARVSDAMLEKYGFVDQMFHMIGKREESVAIRLDPPAADPTPLPPAAASDLPHSTPHAAPQGAGH